MVEVDDGLPINPPRHICACAGGLSHLVQVDLARQRHRCLVDSPHLQSPSWEFQLSGFPISDARLQSLASTRGGRVALAGFEYQRAFAVLRLTSMFLGQAVRGASTEIPVWIRYEWAEDIDELGADGRFTLWQCKHGTGWTEPAQLAQVMAGFAPKLLWTPAADRHRLQFRLVSSDPGYAVQSDDLPHVLPQRAQVRARFLTDLQVAPGERSDRRQWQAEADALGHEGLFDALWQAFQVLYMPARIDPGTAPLWPAEKHAAVALTMGRRLRSDLDPADAVRALHALLAAHPPAADANGEIARATAGPQSLRPIDVADRLYSFGAQAATATVPLRLIDRALLRDLKAEPTGERYVARRPEWPDVVRGDDTTIGFFERTITEAVVGNVRQALAQSMKHQGRLRLQCLVGAPGAGKSTLVLRVAARLVEDGACSVVDARFSFSGGEDTQALTTELHRLSEGPRPLLLLLDDPLGVGSVWPEVMQKLSRSNPSIVVLAATPDFLLERHRHELHDVDLLQPVPVNRPDAAERRALVAIYPGLDMDLLQRDDELLVLAMQAAAGQSFDTIIYGIWRTLAGGQNLPAQTLGRELPWAVAAYWLVVFFHRAYAPCPLPVLQAVLASRPGDGGDAADRLMQMQDARGWRFFQIEHPPARFAHVGSTIRTIHARVAQRAWACRPARGWNIAGSIAQASLECPNAIRKLTEGLSALHAVDPAVSTPVIQTIAEAWAGTAGASLETRYLCDISALWVGNQLPIPDKLVKVLYDRVYRLDAQSWLAALQLLRAHSRGRAVSARVNLPYEALIDAADFSLAPNRTVLFSNVLSDRATLRQRIAQRLWRAFDGQLDWPIHRFLLTWLLTHGGKDAVQSRMATLRTWLAEHPDDISVRTAFIGHIYGSPAANQVAVIKDYRIWLALQPDNTSVRTAFLRHVLRLPATDQAAVIKDYRSWLAMHPDDTCVRTAFLRHVLRLPAADQATLFQDYRTWLAAHPDDTIVRTGFLNHVPRRLPAADQATLFQDYRTWLAAHPDDTVVRTAFLSHIPELPAADQATLFQDYRTWLAAHPDDTVVRTAFLSHIPGLPTADRAALINDYHTWLAAHPDDAQVRTAFLGLAYKLPAADQAALIEDCRIWLAAHLDDAQVRAAFLGHVPGLPAADQAALLNDYRTWLAAHPDDVNVRSAFLSHVPELPTADQAAVLKDYHTWLAAHPDNEHLRTSFLGHVSRLPAADQAAVLNDYRAWLAAHPDNRSVRTSFLNHLPGLPAADRAAALDDYRAWLAAHPNETHVRATLLRHVPRLSTADQAVVLNDYRTWLAAHPGDTSVRGRYLALMRARPTGKSETDL